MKVVGPSRSPPPAAEGLTAAVAAERLREHGPNAIEAAPRPRHWHRFLSQFVHLFALLLWAGAALAWLGGLPQLSAAIAAVIVINAVFAFVQEYRAERATEELRKLLPLRACVRRDGVVVEVPAEDVVVGDLLELHAGDRVPADAEIVVRARLRVDESTLTGESHVVEPLTLVYAGTYVAGGAGEALVVATGMETKFGRIAALTQQVRRERSPLEREMHRLTRVVATVSLCVGAAFFSVAAALGMGLDDRFVFAIGVMVALVPEGLLPTVTLSLALATQRMARRRALVRQLSSVETLGETTVICTDKTGTLTENQMTVERVWTLEGCYEVEGSGYDPNGSFRRNGTLADPEGLEELMRAGLLCNDSELAREAHGWTVVGDPTEGALVALAAKGGLRHDLETARFPRVGELPFDSNRKRMSTVHSSGDAWIAYVKGAASEIVPRTTLPPGEQERVLAAEERLERAALRVLAVARRRLEPGTELEEATVETDLELLGLVGMLDPPRPEVPDALARCRRAGIRVIMVTGDSGYTAEAIAIRIGLVDDRARIVSGEEVAALNDEGLAELLREPDAVFARIDPEEKLRIARVLRTQGEIVAMTGDGVNDAPALKEADIGIAMGLRGTDVAKESADMILLDDNFATIVDAVEEGRAVYDNIRRFTGYHFCSNVGELVPFVVWGCFLGAVPLPLVVMQVLAVDLGTDMVPAIALGTERAERGTMTRPPRSRSDRLLNAAVFRRVGVLGSLEGLAAMTSFLLVFGLAGWRPWDPLPDSGALYVQATAMAYAGIVAAQIGAGLAMRTDRVSVFTIGLLSNRLLLVGIAVEIGLLALLVYTPGLRDAFHMEPLEPWHWLSLLVWPPLVLGADELRKALVRRRD
jgi:magnesium-transporting ATPase (P-type)